MDKSFFGSFFSKKELLAFLPLALLFFGLSTERRIGPGPDPDGCRWTKVFWFFF
jgi:hypothetical protein